MPESQPITVRQDVPGPERSIAYFSMEIGLESRMPTYSGGLGVLAGDTVRAGADLNIPMVAVSLLYRKGYFRQEIDGEGRQTESPVGWAVEEFLLETPPRVSVSIEGRAVGLRAWKYVVRGAEGFQVPVYLLDSDLSENTAWDRALTHSLYGGDARYRLCQETLLGIGGVRMLRALGYRNLLRFHMNEGHASLLTLELLDEEAKNAGRGVPSKEDVESVRQLCVFTTHTPVPAGHDKFPVDLVARVLGPRDLDPLRDCFHDDGVLNMTCLALSLSHFVNGVAKRHGEVSRTMFANYDIDSITNGVHAATWTAPPFQELFDRYIPGWRQDNFSLRYALSIPKPEVWKAHLSAKKRLIEHVNQTVRAGLDPNVFTIGFARRATAYKRGDLIFHDMERLKRISSRAGSFQMVFAGKAHPQDEGGKEIIRRIFQAKDRLRSAVPVAYLPDHSMEQALWATSGSDLWLNTPLPPLEASGTSGMKAALNGVPSLSVPDGWWLEGHIEGVTGWSIGDKTPVHREGRDPASDAASLYGKLENVILPQFYRAPDSFIDVMRHAVALNGSFFTTQRMMLQYVLHAYFG
ncbi:MAG: alpha-glucan family phosphorylase [Elusimicrobia bacterium]|nr:alpha-glucan family phosphorylase [Elusimicrobiota bacterium]